MDESNGGITVILVSILLILGVATIIYFAYFGNNGSKLSILDDLNEPISYVDLGKDANTTNNSSIPKLIQDRDKNIWIKAQLEQLKIIKIKKNDLHISGKPTILCNENDEFIIVNPKIEDFEGTIDLNANKIYGKAKSIISGENILKLGCEIDLENFEKISLNNFVGDFEKNRVNGVIDTEDLQKELNNAYLRIKNYTGKLIINKDIMTLDGNAIEIQIVQNGTNIVIN